MSILARLSRQDVNISSLGFKSYVRHIANSASSKQLYAQSLMKRFLFYTHPDFFGKFEKIQEVNSSNIRALQSVIDNPSDSHSGDETRTLTFFLKPSDWMPQPRKVKVSLVRILDSLGEILETIGETLPLRPSELRHESRPFSHDRNRREYENHGDIWIDAETKSIISFIESLVDRREILRMKEERYRHFKLAEESLIHRTKLKEILYWNSWSAHNNALLLHHILQGLDDDPDSYHLPWSELSLIITKDHGFPFDVDLLEGVIRLDSGQVAAVWMKSLAAINQQDLQAAAKINANLKNKKQQFEKILTYQLDSILRKSNIYSDRRIEVKVEKGFTCTQRAFGQFIHNHFLSTSSPNVTLKPHSNDKAETSSSYLEMQPVCMILKVEEAHGTKLLKDGTLRIDSTCSTTLMNEMLANHAVPWLGHALQQEQDQEELERLKKHLCHVLMLRSIARVKGVTDQMLLNFLRQMHEYLLQKERDAPVYSPNAQPPRGLLRGLQDMKLVVGQYASITEDGSCVLPWSFQIQNLR